MKNEVLDAQKLYVFRIRMAGQRARQEVVIAEEKKRKALKKAFKAKIKKIQEKENDAIAKIEAAEETIRKKTEEYNEAMEILGQLEPGYPLPPLNWKKNLFCKPAICTFD